MYYRTNSLSQNPRGTENTGRPIAHSAETMRSRHVEKNSLVTASMWRKLNRTAFTLVELMVVIVIIGLLAGAVALGTRSYLISGKQAVAKLEISRICQALDTFYSAFDRFPSNDEGIEILAEPSKRFAAGLLSQVPTDPWGHPYEYVQPGRNSAYEVISFGADGREGGTGADRDIISTQLGNKDQ